MAVRISRIAADQWRELRAIRLEALQEAPDAFGDSFAAAVERPDTYWQARAGREAASPDSALFVASDPQCERLVGMAGAFVSEADRETAWLISMYVSPAYRGSAGGVGGPVVHATVDWLRGTAVQAVKLNVFPDNARATAFYRRLGFCETDVSAVHGARKLTVMELESFG